MKIAMGSRYRKDFLKIMNRPKRYISRDSLDEETVAFDVWEWFYEDKPWVAERIQRLEYDIKMLSTMSPYAAINYIRRGIGYDEFCVEYADYRRMNVEDLYEVLEELQNSAKGFDTYNDWFEHIENYTAELEKIYRQQNQNPESVALATLHSSKGLEYDNVYIIDVNEGIMPYKKAVLDNEVEEERRMFYVGMTRAKKKLHLYSIEFCLVKQFIEAVRYDFVLLVILNILQGRISFCILRIAVDKYFAVLIWLLVLIYRKKCDIIAAICLKDGKNLAFHGTAVI